MRRLEHTWSLEGCSLEVEDEGGAAAVRAAEMRAVRPAEMRAVPRRLRAESENGKEVRGGQRVRVKTEEAVNEIDRN